MTQNILITGAAGYIGGSLLADLLSRTDETFKAARYFAAVRAPEQVEALSKLHVNIVKLDVNDKAAVEEAVVGNEIDIVVHTAGSMYPDLAFNVISALGQRRQKSGKDSSVTTMFSDLGGWPYGEVKDTDAGILQKEKEIGGPNPVRLTNILVADEGKARNVTTLNVAVPMVYGRGYGKWRKLSVNIPAFIRTSIKLKTVYKFDQEGSPPACHISDMSALFVLLLEKILRGESVPHGEEGYYFAMAHRSPYWKVMEGLAKGLYSRGLVTEPTVQVWPDDDMASENLGFPRTYIRAIGTSRGDLVPVNAFKLGWKPKWDEKRFLDSIDDEIAAVEELDTIKMSLFDSMDSK
ncbi:hypothetical protein NM208_g1129 [Fusarium decemcellulare]|uniref:Uncharacterized protein n=2 Tax=Fusarium decemcellulare TaxID=57161 RepID=A0ACC1SAG4_9HYPO|nr:hypothetical protein NM208_g7164 [Fusarium decemcellulare]KAJ3548191.1 hypothetical protein NM208_g1129 [Fusarium decemcellulare]